MKKILNFRKSISWVYCLLLIAACAAFVGLYSHQDWSLFALGFATGLAIEGFSSILRARGNKQSKYIEVLLLLGCVTLIMISALNLQLLSVEFGAVLIIFILQIGTQIGMKKMITWEDIRENRD